MASFNTRRKHQAKENPSLGVRGVGSSNLPVPTINLSSNLICS